MFFLEMSLSVPIFQSELGHSQTKTMDIIIFSLFLPYMMEVNSKPLLFRKVS